ncbi:tetratricopeptide repeat protein [Neorhodopirellula pilleata]|uniref:TPR repeat-containing protein YrrB n=1 Tax=Neorhodopirellula pilleata TaxID=2714738 RepID=A0A5C6ARB5_9BACT|nr:tetratricopeptide repeat protein [Neorhodopirellula pilleata]TWU02021.1 TPR repeat-containing protein YrrB [Neorhodopirellula pilleata]
MRLGNTAAAIALLLITLLVYLPAIGGGFIWDDDDYVTENPTLHDLSGLKAIWFDPSATPQYYPLVHSSFWIENHLWGLHPLGYHLVNVLIHAANALLLWRLLVWLGVPVAGLIAMIFAVHPVHVESVAWITERKNVLSGLFYLSAAWCFLNFRDFTRSEDSPSSDRWRWYAGSLACFIGALLSKTVAATFPAALLVMIWWKRGQIRASHVIGLAPFFVLGITLGLLTVWLEKNQVGASGIDWELSFLERCLIAGRALWFYAGKLIWPAPLIFSYQRWDIDLSQTWQWLFPIAAIGVMLALFGLRHRVGRGPLAAVLFFAGTLFPALGFFDVYPMRFSFVADHFQYLASIGVISLVVVTGNVLFARWFGKSSRVQTGAAVVVVSCLGTLTWQQGRVYHDVETLWRDTLAKNPTSFLAHNNLGAILNRRGEFIEAESHLRQAVALKPGFADSVVNLAKAREGQSDFGEALTLYEEATRISPGLAVAWNGLGATYGMKGDFGASEKALLQALKLDRSYAQTHSNLATLYASQGRFEEAVAGYQAAIELDAELIEVRENLARVLMSLNRPAEAQTQWQEVLQRSPKNTVAMLNLGVIAAGDQRLQTAANYFEQVIEIDRKNLKAIYNAAVMHEQLGNANKANQYFGMYELLQPSSTSDATQSSNE